MAVLKTTTDELLGLVTHERRREVLRRLIEAEDGTAQVDELVGALEDGPGPTGSRSSRIEVQLHHRHLPMLEEAGVVEYDPERGTVRYRSQPRLERLLAFVSDEL